MGQMPLKGVVSIFRSNKMAACSSVHLSYTSTIMVSSTIEISISDETREVEVTDSVSRSNMGYCAI